MSKLSFYCWIFVLSMLTLLTFPYFLHILSIIFLSKRFSVWSQLEMYKWMACGFCLFFFLRTLIRKNLTWFETFSHELTHIVVAVTTQHPPWRTNFLRVPSRISYRDTSLLEFYKHRTQLIDYQWINLKILAVLFGCLMYFLYLYTYEWASYRHKRNLEVP